MWSFFEHFFELIISIVETLKGSIAKFLQVCGIFVKKVYIYTLGVPWNVYIDPIHEFYTVCEGYHDVYTFALVYPVIKYLLWNSLKFMVYIHSGDTLYCILLVDYVLV